LPVLTHSGPIHNQLLQTTSSSSNLPVVTNNAAEVISSGVFDGSMFVALLLPIM
jgi:hypothetical protein